MYNNTEIFKIVTETDFFEYIKDSPIHSTDTIINAIMPGMGEYVTVIDGVMTIEFLVFGLVREKLVISDNSIEYQTNESPYYDNFKYGDLAQKLLKITQ